MFEYNIFHCFKQIKCTRSEGGITGHVHRVMSTTIIFVVLKTRIQLTYKQRKTNNSIRVNDKLYNMSTKIKSVQFNINNI